MQTDRECARTPLNMLHVVREPPQVLHEPAQTEDALTCAQHELAPTVHDLKRTPLDMRTQGAHELTIGSDVEDRYFDGPHRCCDRQHWRMQTGQTAR